MSSNPHIDQNLSDLRTDPVWAACEKWPGLLCIAKRLDLICQIANAKTGRTQAAASSNAALDYQTTSITSPISRSAIPTGTT
jgi:hypothetical protein